jgi:hypothetical protein
MMANIRNIQLQTYFFLTSNIIEHSDIKSLRALKVLETNQVDNVEKVNIWKVIFNTNYLAFHDEGYS